MATLLLNGYSPGRLYLATFERALVRKRMYVMAVTGLNRAYFR
jgi:hypothetical protein